MPQKWTPEEDQLVETLVAEGLTISQIAPKVGRSVMSIHIRRSYRRNKSKPPRQRYEKRPQDDDEGLLEDDKTITVEGDPLLARLRKVHRTPRYDLACK